MNEHTKSLLIESYRDAGGNPNSSPATIWNLMRRKNIIYTARLIISERIILVGKEPLYRKVRAWAEKSGHVIDIGIEDIPDALRSIGIPSNWVLEDGLLLNRQTVSYVMQRKGT